MDNTTKGAYIDLVQKIQIDQELKDPLINFIETYDGTNKEDFKVLLITTVLLLTKYAELDLKAQGYDAMPENSNDYKMQLSLLKDEYYKFNDGKAPTSKPHISVEK